MYFKVIAVVALLMLCFVIIGVLCLVLFKKSSPISANMPTVPDGFKSYPGHLGKDKPVTAEDVRAFEASLGMSLPSDYKEFLLTCNGFTFDEEMEHLIDNSKHDWWPPHADVRTLICFSLNEADISGLAGFQKAYAFNERVPQGYLAVGRGSAQSIVAISLLPEDCGCVYYFQGASDSGDVPGPQQWRLSFVAKSFKDFWNELEPWQYRE